MKEGPNRAATASRDAGEQSTTALYRRALVVLPSELADGAAEMTQTYDDAAAAARRHHGRAGEWRLLATSLVGLGRCTLTELAARRRRARSEAAALARAAGSARTGGRTTPRERGGLRMWTDDLRHSLRTLRRRPRYALGVVLLVALGVGGVTAVFSVVDGVLLRSLPYPDAERLVHFGEGSHSGPLLGDWQQRLTRLDDLAASWVETVPLTGAGSPQRLRQGRVSESFFDFFGARPAVGRLLVEDDFASGSEVTVLGHALWLERFGGERDVVGRAITVAGRPLTVVGVLERGFREPEALVGDRVDLWVPLDRSQELLTGRNVHVLEVAGRLAEGATLEAAQDELDAVSTALAEEFPDSETDRDGNPHLVPLRTLHAATTTAVEGPLRLLLAAVGAMLLISCANVASLALARVSDRSRELSLRSALGASRSRVGFLLMVESLVLALLGGGVGMLFAWGALAAFRRSAPSDVPRLAEVALDGRVMVFAVGLSLVTGLVFGVAPAWRSARVDVASALREQNSGQSVARQRLRSALVVAQVALALTLTVGSALLFHSFLRLRSVALGFEPERVVAMHVQHGQFGGDDAALAEERVQLAEALIEEIAALPGVDAVGLGWGLPFDFVGGSRCCWRMSFVDSSVPPDRVEGSGEPAMVNPVTPDYFRVLGIPVLEGRALDATDDQADPPAIVLNRSLADRLFPDGDAVGSLVRGGREDAMRVVGVVADFKSWGLDQDADSGAFVSYRQFGGPLPFLSVAVRTRLPLDAVADPLRSAVWTLDPDLPIESIVTLDEKISRSIAEPRFYSSLLVVFAAMALTLAAVGLYGALLFAVGQRVREMGVRLALGAERADVLRLVVGQGLGLVAIGLALGVAASLAGSRMLASRLFEISPNDPWSLTAACLVLAGVSFFACWLPARRAAATDPVETLRAE